MLPNSSIRLDCFQRVLDGFRKLRASATAPRLARMGDFVDGFSGLVAARPPRFNALSVLRVGPDEVVHSGVLAWLLDGSSGHGQGPLFLNAFASSLDLPIDLGPGDLYLVRREFAGLESIIDVCVCRTGDFLLFIENKILAAEGPSQADRELRDMRPTGEANAVPEERQFAVFLTPYGRYPISGEPSIWRRISYSSLAEAFRAALAYVGDARVEAFVTDWIETVEQWGTGI